MSHNHGVIRLQISPAQIYVGRYEAMPYPNLTPAQEFVFEVAILVAAPVTISENSSVTSGATGMKSFIGS